MLCMLYNILYKYLRIGSLCENISHGVGVSRESVDAGLGPHVPDSSSGVSPSSEQDINGGMEGHAVDPAQMAVVVANHLPPHIGEQVEV